MKLKKIAGKVVAVTAASVGSAYAAVPAAVTTSLGDLKTDTETVAGLGFAAFLVIVLFAYMRRAAH